MKDKDLDKKPAGSRRASPAVTNRLNKTGVRVMSSADLRKRLGLRFSITKNLT